MQQTAVNEDDLVSRARGRDEAAIRVLIRSHNRRLYRIARSILRDDAEAEDAVQETYLKAFLHLDEFRGDAAIGTWLSRIVMNEALGRRRRRRPTVDWSTMEENGRPSAEIIRLPVGTSRPDPERATAQRQLQQLVEHAIDQLPDDFRTVFVARVVKEMSIEETAALLDVLPETVKTRLHRARQRLRSALEAKIGPVLKEVFPFEAPRCQRIADNVLRRLNLKGESREPSPTDRI